MDIHVKELLDDYAAQIETFHALKDFLVEFLRKIICVDSKLFVAGIEARVKAFESLEGKLNLKGYKYRTIEDITDLVGARVITFYSDHVDYIASLIEKYFEIDYDNSVDKRKIYDVDRFGYMSLHYICKVPKSLYYDEKYPKLNDYKFEIQMRTSLQHVWATIFHDTGYKSDVEVPKEYIRRLARLEGMLEIADDEFLVIRNEIDEYRKKIRSLVSKGEFKDISLNIDSYKNYLSLDPYKPLVNRIAGITGADVENVSYLRFYEILIDLGVKTLSEVEQMRIDNSEDAYKLSLAQLGGTDIDIISSSVAIQNILIIYALKQKKGKEYLKHLLDAISGRSVSDAYVEKVLDQTKAIIMI